MVRDGVSVGARVKALREAMDLSLRDLAARSGVSAPMLSQVERGETSPTLATAERIAAGLDLSLSQLLRLDERPHISVTRAGQGRTARAPRPSAPRSSPRRLPGQRADVSRHTLEPGAATGNARRPAAARAGRPRDGGRLERRGIAADRR